LRKSRNKYPVEKTKSKKRIRKVGIFQIEKILKIGAGI
jgi:hypothetical protein